MLVKEIEYLGHVVNVAGIKTDPSRVEIIKRMPSPKDLTSLRSFLGMVGYVRNFIEGFSIIAEPLFKLLKNKA